MVLWNGGASNVVLATRHATAAWLSARGNAHAISKGALNLTLLFAIWTCKMTCSTGNQQNSIVSELMQSPNY